MRYRGFNITNCIDHGIERYDYDKREMKTYDGYYCEIYPGNDDMYANRLDYFCLAKGIDIPDMSDQSLEDAICKHVDDNISSLRENQSDALSNRNADLLGRAVCFIGEFQAGEDLYNTLTDQLGMTDDEIRMIGFKSLVPFFDQNGYAQTIAEYMIDEGTELTSSGNYHFSFDEINERFGTNLPSDKAMLDKILDEFSPDIVADIDTTEDFDLMFYLAYCPNAEEDETLTPQMQITRRICMDKNKLKQLADYCVHEGCEFSENGYWSISYDELFHHFGEDVSDVNENGKELEKELKQRDEINELIMTEDCIEMTYHMEHCANCDGNPISLLSVLGCNVYDEHFGTPEKMSDNKPIIMNAVMERKASEYDYTRCVVDKIVEVSKSAFESFLRAPINDYDFIDDFNYEEHDYRSNTRPCLLLLGEEHDDGVLINTEGYPYARYSSYIPHARQIVEAHEMEQLHDTEPEEDESPVLSM